MISTVLLGLLAGAVLLTIKKVLHFQKRLREVKASGIPYVIVPVHSFNRFVEVTRPLWFPWVDRLPESWKGQWLMLIESNKLWKRNYNIFRAVGADNFITLTFNGDPELFTADPDTISQITSRKVDFPKPLRQYVLLDVYGRNVVTTEGHDWRRHRKIVGPPFTEKNNHLVWTESIFQAQAMLDNVLSADKKSTPSIKDLDPLVSYIALAVISKAGYGVRLGWKDKEGVVKYVEEEEERPTNPLMGRDWIEGKTHGHMRSFGETLYLLSRDLLFVLLLPEILLKHLPFERTKSAGETYKDWDNYMKEMVFAKRKEMDSVDSKNANHDILTSLVRHLRTSSSIAQSSNGTGQKDDANTGLSDSEILGNAFVLMIAGHETSAGVLEHGIMMMALDPTVQDRLHTEIDEIFEGKSHNEWDYERDFARLFGGMAGAIMAEVLRLIPPVMAIPKWCINEQTFTAGGKSYHLPAQTEISLDLAGVHRNPKHWPHGKPTPGAPQYSGLHGWDDETDLGEFKPERWLNHAAMGENGDKEDKVPDHLKKNDESEELAVNMAADNAASLYKPLRGAYLPFSEGFRSCMGRRFAQVEVMAVLAVIFQHYSVELAVDAWATDAEVEKMTPAQRKNVWMKAKANVQDGFQKGMDNRITIKMRDRSVPLRFVKRGSERFKFDDYNTA